MSTPPFDSSDGVKLLADAWDKSQTMMIDASKQGALVAAIILGFVASITKSQNGPPSVWAISCAVWASLSVLSCAVAIAANAHEQQLRLHSLTVRGQTFDPPKGFQDEIRQILEPAPPATGVQANSLREGLQFLVRKRSLAIRLIKAQVILLTAALLSFVLTLMF